MREVVGEQDVKGESNSIDHRRRMNGAPPAMIFFFPALLPATHFQRHELFFSYPVREFDRHVRAR